MAGFFPNNNQNKNNNNINNQQSEQEGWYVYRNDTNSYELWPQQPQQPPEQALYQTGRTRSADVEEYNRVMMLGGSSSSGGGGTISCQDCGNQAKKDCVHMRCRTCCKSRGFDCATHIKSSWVPASVRRHRHHNLAVDTQQQQQVGQTSDREGELGVVKRRRESNVPILNTTSSSSFLVAAGSQLPVVTTRGMELGNFPAELSSPAVFRCVRVSSMDDTEDEVAYQTAVKIGGHVFKGILYDQGPDQGTSSNPNTYIGGGSRGEGFSSGGQPLSLTAGTTTSTTAMVALSPLALGYLDPSLYPGPFSPYMQPGTPFFPNPRP